MSNLKYLRATNLNIKNKSCLWCKKGTHCSKHSNSEPKYHQEPIVVHCSEDLMKYIIGKKIIELVLIAETQTGKSDVMKRISEIAYVYPNEVERDCGIINIFVWICVSDNKLREELQAKLDPYVRHDHILHIKDMDRLVKFTEFMEKKDNDDKLKPSQQKDCDLLEKMSDNCLIFVDEAHCDTKERQVVDNLRNFLSIGFKQDNKNETVKIINISATPYAFVKTSVKPVILKPRPGYYGIKDMFENDKVFDAYDLVKKDDELEKWFDHMLETLGVDTLPNGKYLIRVGYEMEDKAIQKKIKELCKEKFNIDVFTYSYNMHSEYDLDKEYLKIEHDDPVFIIIKDRLRQGATITKTHIVAVHDSKQNTFIHTTYQGLLGRMTGYNANKETLIYCDKQNALDHLEWIENKYSADTVPTCKNKDILKSGVIRKGVYLE